MRSKKVLGALNDKVENIKKSLNQIKEVKEDKTISILQEISLVLCDIVAEVSHLKEKIEEINEKSDDFDQRVTDIEEFLEELDENSDDLLSVINCPYCGEEVELDEEFLMAEEPKLICNHCHKEIEFLTQCLCGDEDCGCEESECEDGCCDCGCGHQHEEEADDSGKNARRKNK